MQDERDISGAVERILDNDCDGGARVSQDTVRALVGLVVGERERAPRCDMCQHWQKGDHWEANAAGFRLCAAMKVRWDIEDEATSGIDKYPDDGPLADVEDNWDEVGKTWMDAMVAGFRNEKAYVQDGSQYHASMWTGPDFSCAKFAAIRFPVSSFGGR